MRNTLFHFSAMLNVIKFYSYVDKISDGFKREKLQIVKFITDEYVYKSSHKTNLYCSENK